MGGLVRGTTRVVAWTLLTAFPVVGGAQQVDTLLIENVTVLPLESDTALVGTSVLVVGAQIAVVGPEAGQDVGPSVWTVEGGGAFLVPGLVDSHVHLRDTTELLGYLAHGVTTVLQLSGPQGRIGDLLPLRSAIRRGSVLGPRILAAGRLIDGDPPIFSGASDVVRSEAQARAIVHSRLEQGYDFLKVYNNLSRAALSALVAEAHARRLLVFGHVPRGEGREGALQHALGAGLDVIVHGEEFFFTHFYSGIEAALSRGPGIPTVDTTGLGSLVDQTRAAGTWVIPNLSFVRQTRLWLSAPQEIFDEAEYSYLPSVRREAWRRDNPSARSDVGRFDRSERSKARLVDLLTLRMHEAGVPLLAGTDASYSGLYPGASLHIELEELQRVGLSPYEVLRTATSVPGELIARIAPDAPMSGVIRPGARADLLLVAEDPRMNLATLAEPIGVVLSGRWFSREQLIERRPSWPRR